MCLKIISNFFGFCGCFKVGGFTVAGFKVDIAFAGLADEGFEANLAEDGFGFDLAKAGFPAGLDIDDLAVRGREGAFTDLTDPTLFGPTFSLPCVKNKKPA